MKTKLFIFGIPTLIIWFVLSTIIYAKISDSSNKIDGQSPEGIACAFIKSTEANGGFVSTYENTDSQLAFYFLGSFYIDTRDEQIKEVLYSIYEYKLGVRRIDTTSNISPTYLNANIYFDLNNSYNALKRACIDKYGINEVMGIN
jgi:hypothetical protein